MEVMQDFTATVSRVRDLTHDVREIALSLTGPASIRFLPGQFVSFEVDRPGRLPATRSYSIASPPGRDGSIELLVNRVEGGPGSGYLFGLREGDTTSFRGPLGSFTLHDGTRDLLFVATGTGIAPLRSMLWTLADSASTRPITLFWGLRSERDLYYQDELEQLRARLPGFAYVTTLSRPAGEWTGSIGWVSALVEQRVPDVDNIDAYLCGNAAMIRDVREILRARGLCPIHTEQYYDDRTARA